MSDYITNSKNRKLKTKILLFLSRINIGAGKLPISGRLILLMEGVLFISLLFPWLKLIHLDGEEYIYYAFSGYTFFVGYMILLTIGITPFFLLSHSKKEKVRAKAPFRLSDTQAIIFVTTIIFVSSVNIFIANIWVYGSQIAARGASLERGFFIALTALIIIYLASYFLSKNNKTLDTQLYYIDHDQGSELDEYRDILKKENPDDTEKNNMTLPI